LFLSLTAGVVGVNDRKPRILKAMAQSSTVLKNRKAQPAKSAGKTAAKKPVAGAHRPTPAAKQPAGKPAAKAPVKPTTKAAVKPVAKAVVKPTTKAVVKPAAKAAVKRTKASAKTVVKLPVSRTPAPRMPISRMTAPRAGAVKPDLSKPVVAKIGTAKPVSKLSAKEMGFHTGDFVVYPTHGVGKITAIEMQEISGHRLQLIAIHFEKDRMTLRVPVAKAQNSGLRRLSTRKVMDTALATLKGRSRIRRVMWSRRAQEYEAKINSGDPVAIAEVVRDLHRGADQPDPSYSERQIYQAALDRLSRELAAVDDIDEKAAAERLEQLLKAA
jgi:CarD family transcriptional regulator